MTLRAFWWPGCSRCRRRGREFFTGDTPGPGNPGGKSREKIFTDALRLELNRVDPRDKDQRRKINLLAEKLVECALVDKQGWAFQQIVERLEGKPVQVVDATVDDHRTLHEFSDAELTAILRRRVGAVPAESDEKRPEDVALN